MKEIGEASLPSEESEPEGESRISPTMDTWGVTLKLSY